MNGKRSKAASIENEGLKQKFMWADMKNIRVFLHLATRCTFNARKRQAKHIKNVSLHCIENGILREASPYIHEKIQ